MFTFWALCVFEPPFGATVLRATYTVHLSAMSHLRERRASLTGVEGSRVKVASVTGHVARRVMARRGDARLVFYRAAWNADAV